MSTDAGVGNVIPTTIFTVAVNTGATGPSTIAETSREPSRHDDLRSEVPARLWTGRGTALAGTLVVVLFGVLAFQHRWIANDGLIVAREVRQILAGAASVGAALMAVWALVTGLWLRPPYRGKEFGPSDVVDERGYETAEYAELQPITTDSRTRDNHLSTTLANVTRNEGKTLVVSTGGCACGAPWILPVSPSRPDDMVFFFDNMGVPDAVMPLNGTVVDVNGLASPLAGHMLVQQRGRPGHEKCSRRRGRWPSMPTRPPPNDSSVANRRSVAETGSASTEPGPAAVAVASLSRVEPRRQ
jgi:hypothetical protein